MTPEEQLRLTNETLYKHSRELAVKNKVLSFLSRLYEISTQTLEQKQLAEQVAFALQAEFDFEIVGIYQYDADIDELLPLSVAVSERIQGLLSTKLGAVNFKKVSSNEFISSIILKKVMLYSEQMHALWQQTELKDACTIIEKEKYVRSSLGYPLIIGDKVIGIVLISLNRIYEDLIDYERESMLNFMNVISITLNRVTLYEELGLANQKLKVLDKQKSEFVSIASHQLRSPLTAIRGYVSMMVEGTFGKLPAEATEALGRIQESTIFMASSIDDFLEVSRIESGNMKYEYTEVNFKDQAEHIVDDLRTDAVKRGLMLLYRSDMQGPGLIRADAGKTQQILHNLINNALKYTPKGSVTVYAHDDVTKKRMYIDIIDTGLGLSQESIVKLFGKFARAKIASSANIMGTGLGLFVAREMARAMGGDITVQSEGEGRGSTFTIVLPLV